MIYGFLYIGQDRILGRGMHSLPVLISPIAVDQFSHPAMNSHFSISWIGVRPLVKYMRYNGHDLYTACIFIVYRC